jgi:hypothetical protein
MKTTTIVEATNGPNTRLFWLSFVDSDRPEGQRNLGVAVVEVMESDIAAAQEIINRDFPKADPRAGAVAAAICTAWATGCNPGGEVGCVEITDADPEKLARAPRHQLMSREDLERLDLL